MRKPLLRISRLQPAVTQSCQLIGSRHAAKSSGLTCGALCPQRSNGEHVDIVFGIVAAEGRGRGDDGAELWLRVACGRVQGDLAAQAFDVADSVANLGFAELDFYRCPAAIVQLDDGINLKPVGVAVVVERARMRAGQA